MKSLQPWQDYVVGMGEAPPGGWALFRKMQLEDRRLFSAELA